MITVLSFHSFSDFFGRPAPKLNEFREGLALLPKHHALKLCCVINLKLNTDDAPERTTAHDDLVRSLFSAKDSRRLLADKRRPVLHRRQMLFILKQLLLHTPDSAITNFDEKLFSLLLLQANDLMHSEELIPEDTAGKLLHIAMQMYGVQENAIGIRASRITRSYTMTSSVFDSAQNKAASFDVPNMFEKAAVSHYQLTKR